MKIFSFIGQAIRKSYRQFFSRGSDSTVPPSLQAAEYWRKRGVKIGENTHLYGPVVLGRDGKDPIRIGSNCILTGCAILGHDASTNLVMGLKRSMVRPVVIEDDCFIGHGAIVLMGVTVGKGSIVGAGAIVTQDVPPGMVVAGNPAKVICTVDELVARRRQEMIQHPEYFPDQSEA
jgi:carbonic anhydrase/acetyltransferase-like protein (isoleucine patch superfamily)